MNSEQKGFTIGLCTAGKRELRISGRTWEIVPRTDLGDSSRLPLHPDSTAVHGGHILLRGLQRQDPQRLS